MSRGLRYFRLQLKRFFKLMPVVLLLSALLVGAIGMALFGLAENSESDEHNSLVKVAIVGDPNDSYLGMALNALQNLDSSRFSLDIEISDDEKAVAEKLRKGELVAYIVLPDDFIGEAMRGNTQKVTCVTSEGAADFGSRIVSELMLTVTQIVENSQRTVYGFQRAAVAFGMDYHSQVYRLGDEVALQMIDVILSRESAYEITEIGTSGAESLEDPLICGMLVLLLMLWGITCCTVFNSRNRALYRVLSSKGTGAVSQVLGEYCAYLLFMTATLAILTLAVVAVSGFIPKLSLLKDYDFARLIPGMLVPVVTISSMQFFLYEVTGAPVSGALLQFFCAMGIGYISGSIYPAYFFPRAVQQVAALLPAWNCRIWLDELLAGTPGAGTFAVLAAYFAAFMVLTVVIRRFRIRQEGGAA